MFGGTFKSHQGQTKTNEKQGHYKFSGTSGLRLYPYCLLTMLSCWLLWAETAPGQLGVKYEAAWMKKNTISNGPWSWSWSSIRKEGIAHSGHAFLQPPNIEIFSFFVILTQNYFRVTRGKRCTAHSRTCAGSISAAVHRLSWVDLKCCQTEFWILWVTGAALLPS